MLQAWPHLSSVVFDGQAEDTLGFVSCDQINLCIKSGVLGRHRNKRACLFSGRSTFAAYCTTAIVVLSVNTSIVLCAVGRSWGHSSGRLKGHSSECQTALQRAAELLITNVIKGTEHFNNVSGSVVIYIVKKKTGTKFVNAAQDFGVIPATQRVKHPHTADRAFWIRGLLFPPTS